MWTEDQSDQWDQWDQWELWRKGDDLDLVSPGFQGSSDMITLHPSLDYYRIHTLNRGIPVLVLVVHRILFFTFHTPLAR